MACNAFSYDTPPCAPPMCLDAATLHASESLHSEIILSSAMCGVELDAKVAHELVL